MVNLLFVEDSRVIQKSAELLFNVWGFGFDMASNGREAVELAVCNEGKYDVCLMDTNMPVMDGLEAIRTLRKKVRYFPIISTSLNNIYEKEVLKLGADDFISKPYDLEQLRRKLIDWAETRTISLIRRKGAIETKKELPMDPQHAKELKELKDLDLIKIKFDDISGAEVVAHKNVINKIVDDFNVKKHFVSTFLNRDPEKPTKCILFSNNCRMPQVYLNETDFEEELRIENEEIEKYSKMIFKSKEE